MSERSFVGNICSLVIIKVTLYWYRNNLPTHPEYYSNFASTNFKLTSNNSVTSRRNLGTTFSAGGLVNFFNNSELYWLVLFRTLLDTSFKLCKMLFSIEHKEAHCLLEKFIRQQQFSFSILHFWGHFLGAHNVWMLPFLVWIRPWMLYQTFYKVWMLWLRWIECHLCH